MRWDTADLPLDAVAIIGVAGRFPGARDVRAHWRNVLEGRDCISRFSSAEGDDSFAAEIGTDPAFVRARGVMDGADQFDADFFNMLAREADLTDPQQRVFLEVAWSAFEDAGYDPRAATGPIGVFAGTSMNTYFLRHVLSDRGIIEEFTNQYQIGDYQRLLGAADYVATRTAYKLGLTGPAMSVHTACSTSLSAVALAVQSLQLFGCDMALAGGASITFPQHRGYLGEDGGMGARDGVCRPFSDDAAGTVFGSGAGAVLLKRLEDAVRDNDPIYAVIRGVGVNNDGGRSVGFTAPSVEGQAQAIAQAWASADVDMSTIGYIEAHGTATPLGDPIEFEGLLRAFRAGGAEGAGFCALGSAKAIVGHLDAAAGVTGLITAAMALHTRTLPPLTHFRTPNPQIRLDGSPFYFNQEARDWPSADHPLRAGVSSFGVGGTNIHLALEAAPPPVASTATADAPGTVTILPLSARTAAGVLRSASALAARLADPDVALADAAATLQSGRRFFDQRAYVVAADKAAAAAALSRGVTVRETPSQAPRIIFMFPGQGAQYPGMARDLYDAEPVFRTWIDRGVSRLPETLGPGLKSLLLTPAEADDAANDALRNTALAQPALFLVEFALAKLLMHRGVQPAAMIGHSVGELVAASLSGALSFEDALGFIAERGRMMEQTAPGGMLSVRLSEAALAGILPGGLDLAAVNAPELVVVAGPLDALEAFETQLDAADIGHRRLHTSRAFHSRMMDGAVEGLAAYAAALEFRTPTVPFVSSTTGDWAPADRPLDGAYWSAHCRETVQFAAALQTVVGDGAALLVEVGPGRALATFARQGLGRRADLEIRTSMPDFGPGAGAQETLADLTGALWQAGADIQWPAVRGPTGQRISLPAYSFEPVRHMIAPPTALAPAESSARILQSSAGVTQFEAIPVPPESAHMTHATSADRKPRLTAEIQSLLADMSGAAADTLARDATFWELGFDSLFMGQIAQKLRRTYGVPVTFRQIMADLPTIEQLVTHLDSQMPPEAPAPAPAPSALPATSPAAIASAQASFPLTPASPGASADVNAVIANQLMVMQALFERQLQALGGQVPALPAPVIAPVPVPAASPAAAPALTKAVTPPTEAPPPATRFKPFKRQDSAAQLTPAQRRYIEDLVARYVAKAPQSKARTQTSRRVLADPRTASGFSEDWKELVFPVVADRAKGSKIWDVDGNEYVDVVNGFGQTAFGHAPDFVVEAVTAQLAEGFAIGPQSPLAGEVARMFADMTGHERITFCNTGSEAVMAAMRLARTVTGKDIVVCFEGDYHGQFDEVLVRPGGRPESPGALPIAPGIPRTSVSNMVVLPYARDESLDWIRAHIDDIAAVLVEPVQSRHPSLQPRDFVATIREVTAANDSALIIDEVVTGFRAHPAGVQGLWGVKGDMATYGKVVGGGMPVGVLAGDARFMDALDGGHWEYGDASVPEVAPTFFAGTFVRHPLVLAAMKAVLLHLQADGAKLHKDLAERTAALVARLNAHLERRGATVRAETFSSWFTVNMASEGRLASLFYPHMRLLGVHIQEGYPCFLTTAHTEDDFRRIETAFVECVDAMATVGIIGGGGASPDPGPDPDPDPDNGAPLTEPQSEIWMAAQLGDEASMAFNESFRLEFTGALDAGALARALARTVARHDALHLRFDRAGERLTAAADAGIRLETVDARSAADPQGVVARILDEEAHTPFDLLNGPVARARLIRTGETAWTFVFTAHHIVCDGWSVGVLLEDLRALYAAVATGQSADLEAAQSFIAFARRQAETGLDPDARRFWCDLHRTPAPPVDLPSDRPRPDLKSFRGATTTRCLPAEVLAAVKAAATQQSCSPFAVMVGAVQVLFGRLSGSDDIVIAAPMAGQFLELDDAPLVGHCVNFLPLRQAFDPTASFARHMTAVRDHLTQAARHQNYTLGALVRDLDVKRDFNRLPLTDIQFNLEKFEADMDMGGVRSRFAPNPKAYANYDLFLNAIESRDGLRLDCDYSTDLFDEATIQRWLGHLETLLRAIGRDSTTLIADLPILSDGEISWLRDDLNRTDRSYPGDRTVLDLVLDQAARTPDRPAVSDGAASLSYAQLANQTARISASLTAAGVAPGGRVAIALERTVSPVAVMLAVWRAGCAYVPIDLGTPPHRLETILRLADVSAIVTDGGGESAVPPGPWRSLPVDSLLDGSALPTAPTALGPGDPAYVIFTSGSTGEPKGVQAPHGALANFMLSMAERPGCSADDRIAAVTTFAFDISGLELLLPLTVGGEVVVVAGDRAHSGSAMTTLVRDRRITILQTTPSVWRLLLETGFAPPAGLKAFCGGEPLPRDLADALLARGLELWNLYGPTETTIWSSAERIGPDGDIVIGTPIANTQMHVLAAGGRLCPPGVPGDLWIGGAGLASGYFGRDDLTSQAFQMVSAEGAAPVRLYRTGDRAIRRADGGLRVIGRSDNQIKLRGFRIDLEDIEAHLARAPGVAAGAVALRRVNGADRLVGYVVTEDARPLDADALSAHLGEWLPSYMTPSHWSHLTALPMTPAGKLDRKALPAPVITVFPTQQAATIPAPSRSTPTSLESKVAAIWAKVLGLESVDVNAKFFSLGADSIQLFRIVARMNEQGLVVEARQLMKNVSVKELALKLDDTSTETVVRRPSISDFKRQTRWDS